MKYVLIFILLCLWCPLAFANTNILDCRFSHSKYTGKLTLDSVGQAYLIFQPKENTKSRLAITSCPMLIEHISDQSRALVPTIKIDFFKHQCTPRLPTNSKVLNPKVYINVRYRPPTARIKWHREHPTAECKIRNISLFDLRLTVRRLNENRKSQ